MPDVDDIGHHLIDYYSSLRNISWESMKAWEQLTGYKLTSWEAEILMDMKDEFESTCSKSEGKDMEAPFAISVEARRNNVLNSFKSLIEFARV